MQSYFRNVVRFHGENKKIRIEIFLPHRAQALITHGPIGAGGLAQSCGGVWDGMYYWYVLVLYLSYHTDIPNWPLNHSDGNTNKKEVPNQGNGKGK